MKQFVFYTHSMYTGFGNVGFIHANLIQKLFTKNNSRNIFSKKKKRKKHIHVGSSSNNGSPEKKT